MRYEAHIAGGHMAIRPFAAEPLARPLGRARLHLGAEAALSLLVVLLALALPVQRIIETAGARTNACASDLVIPFLLLAYRRTWLRSGPLGVWLLALWLINLISWCLSVSILEPNDLVREMAKVLTCCGYALVGFALGRDVRRESLLVKTLTGAGVMLALAGLVAFFMRTPAFLIRDARVVGTFTDPNGYGVYLAMLFPLAAALPVGWLVLPGLAMGVVATLSRTGVISVAAGMLLSMLHVSWRKYVLLVAICAIAFAIAFSGALSISTTSRVLAYQSTLETRQALWAIGWETAAAHPFFGIGRGNWSAVTDAPNIPHNTFLSIASDNGFVGLFAFALPVLFWLGRGIRRRAARRWAIAVGVALIGGMAVSFDNFRPFWLALGVLVGELSLPATAGRLLRATPAPRDAE